MRYAYKKMHALLQERVFGLQEKYEELQDEHAALQKRFEIQRNTILELYEKGPAVRAITKLQLSPGDALVIHSTSLGYMSPDAFKFMCTKLESYLGFDPFILVTENESSVSVISPSPAKSSAAPQT